MIPDLHYLDLNEIISGSDLLPILPFSRIFFKTRIWINIPQIGTFRVNSAVFGISMLKIKHLYLAKLEYITRFFSALFLNLAFQVFPIMLFSTSKTSLFGQNWLLYLHHIV